MPERSRDPCRKTTCRSRSCGPTRRRSSVPADLDAFWAATLADARTHDLAVSCTQVDTGLTVVDTFDVVYAGFGGSHGSGRGSTCPPVARDRCPSSSSTMGYGGGRGLPHERILFAAAGYAHLVMDTRGQGSGWAVGDTPDPDADRCARSIRGS